MARDKQSGFTLIELLIAVAIAAILASIAYPAYQEQVMKTRRSDGIKGLMEIAGRQAGFKSNYAGYTTTLLKSDGCAGSACGLGFASTDSTDGHYTLSVVAGAAGIATSYVARAAPKSGGPQTDDECGTLTLTETGTQGVTGTGVTVDDCW